MTRFLRHMTRVGHVVICENASNVYVTSEKFMLYVFTHPFSGAFGLAPHRKRPWGCR